MCTFAKSKDHFFLLKSILLDNKDYFTECLLSERYWLGKTCSQVSSCNGNSSVSDLKKMDAINGIY